MRGVESGCLYVRHWMILENLVEIAGAVRRGLQIHTRLLNSCGNLLKNHQFQMDMFFPADSLQLRGSELSEIESIVDQHFRFYEETVTRFSPTVHTRRNHFSHTLLS